MATSKYFDGKIRKLPGVYSDIKSGIQNLPQTSDYSKVLILDTGTGAAYGGKSGINGENESGVDSIYEFTDLVSAREFWKGGIMWNDSSIRLKKLSRMIRGMMYGKKPLLMEIKSGY